MAAGYLRWYETVITDVRLGSGDVLSQSDILSSSIVHLQLKKFINKPEKGLIELHRIYANEENISSQNTRRIALWAAYFGDYDFAMDALEKSVSRSAEGVFFVYYPVMRGVRQLPRFKEFLREIGLVDYWKQYGWPDLCHPVSDDDFVCE